MDTNKEQSKQVLTIKGDWTEQAKKLQSKFPTLTESDLKFEEGKEHELLTRVENKLNKKREEVIDIIHNSQTQ
ncbi:hypothetical protein [Rurimicrobium arvi]|uniref:General stress protein CsbD n=1 Tax=Rurimicrobium arvi TaxID=2049916 RepID=A0ABP8MYY1_9BACT